MNLKKELPGDICYNKDEKLKMAQTNFEGKICAAQYSK